MKPAQSYIFTYKRADGSRTRLWRRSVQDLAAQRRWFKKTFVDLSLESVELDWTTPLLAELGKPENEAALKRLQDKCRWEQITPSAALLDYGDPREWK